MQTFAILMAGGSGTRFWPASRRARPKQYLPIGGKEALIAQTFARLAGLVASERTLVVTAKSQLDEVRRALPSLPCENILVEPVARNTAPCVAWAAHEIARREPDSLQIVLPADHVIRPIGAFQQSLRAALAEARASEALFTFGIRPSYPATGFGYIETGERASEREGIPVLRVKSFVEKPELEQAKALLARGNFLWNSGLFVWRTRAILDAIATHTPEIAQGLKELERGAALEQVYPALPSISVDRGILERAANVQVLPIDYFWSDIGSWEALPSVLEPDADGNFVTGGGETLAKDAQGCVVYGESGQLTALIGVRDLIVVRSGNAILVCPRERAQEVKDLVERLQQGKNGFL
jgi:mannose-1-phosphate guanylyltransferase